MNMLNNNEHVLPIKKSRHSNMLTRYPKKSSSEVSWPSSEWVEE